MTRYDFKPDPLNDEEFDELDNFLASIETHDWNMESVDGFFCALLCQPDLVMPSQYLPQIWGEDYAFTKSETFQRMSTLLMRHWNTIVAALHITLHEDNVYMPVFLVDEDGVTYGNDWATGFMRAVTRYKDGWHEIITDDEQGGILIPIMMLAHEHDTDPEMRPPPIDTEQREKLLHTMIAYLTSIYRYYAPHRQARGVPPEPKRTYSWPFKRISSKIGRNDPCTCGSGKKYKVCCIDKDSWENIA
jgi:uncharacterized protein